MTIASNLYAEKVFSEQPLALWALDDDVMFLSLTPNINSWESPDAESITVGYDTATFLPMQDEAKIEVVGVAPATPEDLGSVTIRYQNAGNLSQLNGLFGSLAVGFYLNAPGVNVSSVSAGIEYSGIESKNTYQFEDNGWGFVSSTIQIPSENEIFDVVITIEYSDSGLEEYMFILNGLSVGQWSEGANAISVGATPVALPSDIATSELYGLPAAPYGLSDDIGYYVASEKQIFARNNGAPIVYGTSSSTRIYGNPGGPSIILPGFGVMNESGKYRENTIEFWVRMDTYTHELRRIFGPIGTVDGVQSSDGLYVHGEFFTLKVGKYSGSYFVGEWGRPMLINIRMGEKIAGLSINGEDVISLNIDASQITFPEKFATIDLELKNQDWLGFYGYDGDDSSIIEIDAVGIYPYRVPAVVAKRRFVYGQGVDFPENLNTAYNGSSVFIDYSFANYTNNYNYPDIGKWGQAASDNLSIGSTYISAPSYTPPTPVFRNQAITADAWLDANNLDNELSSESRNFISMRPTGFDDENGYLFFNKLNSLSQDVAAVYGVFKPVENSETEQTLVYIENEINKNFFSITLTENVIAYKFKYGSQAVQTLYSVETIVPDIAFSVGFNIQNLSNTYGRNIKTFFGSKDQLRVYIGGNKEFNSTFTGKIFNVGFSSARNAKKISSFFTTSGIADIPTDLTDVFYLYFDDSEDGQIDFTSIGGYIDPISGTWVAFESTLDGGFADSFVFGRFQDHIASYTMVPIVAIDRLSIDIATDSYWEDYLPLSYFASYVSDSRGGKVLSLDFLQFNISNPRPSILGRGSVDTSDSIVRSYVTFQYLADGSNTLDEYFIYRELPQETHVVSPGENWLQTKYEVVSGDTIKLPNGADFNNLSIGIHIEMINPGILSHPVKITNLQLASQSLNYTVPNSIGTRFGNEIYPYNRGGIYYNYKNIAPYSIYKGSTPYLYMSKYSGLKLLDNTSKNGISIPINTELVSEYAVGAIQFATQYQEGLFPESPVEIFEVQSSNFYAKFYMVAENASRTRGKVYGVNQYTKELIGGIAYYLNGNIVKDLFLESETWSIIGIQFSSALIFEGEVGAIRFTGPLMFNNVSYYQLPSTQTSLSVIFRRWSQLSELANLWEDLTTPLQLLWQDILYISTERSYTIDPSTIFKEYTGTNRVLATSDKTLTFGGYQYSVYKDVRWRSAVVIPV